MSQVDERPAPRWYLKQVKFPAPCEVCQELKEEGDEAYMIAPNPPSWTRWRLRCERHGNPNG